MRSTSKYMCTYTNTLKHTHKHTTSMYGFGTGLVPSPIRVFLSLGDKHLWGMLRIQGRGVGGSGDDLKIYEGVRKRVGVVIRVPGG